MKMMKTCLTTMSLIFGLDDKLMVTDSYIQDIESLLFNINVEKYLVSTNSVCR